MWLSCESCDCIETVMWWSCDSHVKNFSHLNSVDLDSEMETISFSEDLPSPMSLVHVAHLLRPSASFPGPHPSFLSLAVQVGEGLVHFLMWVTSWVERLSLNPKIRMLYYACNMPIHFSLPAYVLRVKGLWEHGYVGLWWLVHKGTRLLGKLS